MKFKVLLPMMLALSVTACNDDDTPVALQQAQKPVAQQAQANQPPVQEQIVYDNPPVQQSPQVVVVQQPAPQQYDSTGHLLTGMMLGHMLPGGGYNHGGNHTTIINKTVVRPRSYYGASRSNATRTRSFSGSRSFSRRR